MRVLTIRWAAGCAAVGSAVLGAGALSLAYVDRDRVPAGLTAWDFSNVFGGVTNLAVPVVGFVLASRRPGNRVGWLLLVGSLALGLGGFLSAYALHALVAYPGSLPAGRAAAWLSSWIWVIPVAVLAFVFLLFPTGRLRSRRWRPAAWFVGGAFTFTSVALLVHAAGAWSDPYSPAGQTGSPLLLAAMLILVVAALVVSVVAVVVRFARSAGEERLQLKWFAAAAVLVVVTFIPTIVTGSVAAAVLSNVAFLCLWVAIGVAVLKYRLYEIDVVISKAVLYGALAVFITAVYAGLVVGMGTLAGGRDSPLLAALAAAVVAVAFQPARQWAGRLANRVVYGRRATPYQVLSDFARRIGGAYSHEDVLPQMAQIVAAGTGAEQVVVWLRVDDQLHPVASAGGSPPAVPPSADGLSVDGQAMSVLPGADMSVPVVHRGDLLGAISVRMPKVSRCARPASNWSRTWPRRPGWCCRMSAWSKTCGRRGSGWSPRRMRRGGGWNATSTTARSRIWSR